MNHKSSCTSGHFFNLKRVVKTLRDICGRHQISTFVQGCSVKVYFSQKSHTKKNARRDASVGQLRESFIRVLLLGNP